MYKFSSATFVFLFFTFSIFAQDESRASITWQVQKYDITASLPQTETDRNLTVKAVLNLKNVSSAAASRLTLRISEKAEVTDVKAAGATADFSKGIEKIDASRNLQRTIVRLPSVAPGGMVAVEVNYKLKVDENSGLHTLSPVGAQFLPLSFWYPTPNSWYFARGADFAPFSLNVNAANGLTVLSSGAAAAGGFEQKLNGQPFFIAGNWDKTEAGGVSVFMSKGAGAQEQQRAQELAALASEAKSFTANLLGNQPDAPLRIVAAKRGAGFSGGGTVFVDDGTFRRQKIDSLTAMNVAEAVAKIWLGNQIEISGDGFGVIREGLPRFIATQFIEQKYGKDIADVERLRQRTAYAAVARRDAPLMIASPIDDFYFASNANKGAMIWRLLAKTVGQNEFFEKIRLNAEDKNLQLSELRAAFSGQKEILDYLFEQVTDMNLLVGLPQTSGAETKIALRNTGSIDAAVNVLATFANNEKTSATIVLRPKSFGEVTFKNPNKIVRVEIDSEKLYPQTDYADDAAPREFEDSDLLLSVKRHFDKQDYINAEKSARSVLRDAPRFDDVRILLARALLAQGKIAEAEKEFRAVLDEKLPTARSLAWANQGLGEIALRANRNADAARFFEETIKADAEYGATLAARTARNKLNSTAAIDESVKQFFAQFDKAAVSNRKAEVDNLIAAGEIPRFSGGISGQAQQWTTRIVQVDKIDADNILVETNLNIKLLNREPESGTAVYRLTKVGSGWKLSGVDIFEVR
jgi:Tfp pilus assembly protein PilF